MTEKPTTRLTMQHIAELAGVSRPAVSAVLNNHWKQVRLKKETRDKIMRVLQKTHYRPSSLGTALVRQRSMLIGVMFPSVDYAFVPRALQAIEDGAEGKGYGVVVMTSRRDPERQEQILHFLQTRHVDGLIFSPLQGVHPPPALAEWVKQGIPAVQLFSLSVPGLPKIPSVCTDGGEIGRLGIKHLLERRHRHIATVSLMKCVVEGVQQIAGPTGKQTRVEHWQAATPQEAFDRWQKAHPRPTAIFTLDDFACPLMNIALRRGIRIPQDLALIGIDDIPAAAEAIVPLTTVRQPKYEQGQAAIQALFELIDGRKGQDRILQPTLIQRQTT